MNLVLTKYIIALFLTFAPLVGYAGDNLGKITMLTEVYPPYNMEVDGKLQGITVDVLEAMLAILNTGQTRADFVLTNWSRAYSMAEKRKNHMVFGTTRTEKREPFFKWVGPITKTTIGIIAPKEKKIVIDKLSDINQFRTGTVLKDIGGQILHESGIEKNNLYPVSGTNAIDLSFKKMQNDRIDLFAYEINVAFYEAKLKGFNLDDFEIIYTLKEGELYFAFNIATDDKIITQWQNALDTIKENGLHKKIIERY
ncbi:MAG: ABC transporter substrate-binding protein [Desulfocapsa sp.]|nr:ABC transporter substrate-binding protein [Desulfocapsa sp.]